MKRLVHQRILRGQRAIVEIIRELRIARGMSQEQLAGFMGIARPEYTRLEHGRRHLRAEEARRAAIGLRVPIAVVFGEQPIPDVVKPQERARNQAAA
jgi:transcriptional regulator with XRE-family HTH domain